MRKDLPAPHRSHARGGALQGGRRPFRSSDVDAVHRASQDLETQRWSKDLRAPQPSQARAGSLHGGQRKRSDRTGLSVVLEAAGELVGTAGIYLRPGRLGPEIGYTVAPWGRRRGYAAEAARALADWGLALGAPRVHLFADVGNAGSQAVARRAGFTDEGVVRSCLPYRDGTRGDAVLFGRVAGD